MVDKPNPFAEMLQGAPAPAAQMMAKARSNEDEILKRFRMEVLGGNLVDPQYLTEDGQIDQAKVQAAGKSYNPGRFVGRHNGRNDQGQTVYDWTKQKLTEAGLLRGSNSAPAANISPEALQNLDSQKLTYTGGTNPILGQPTSGGVLGEQPASNVADGSGDGSAPGNPNLYAPSYTTPFEDMLAEEQARKDREKREEQAALAAGYRQQGWGY